MTKPIGEVVTNHIKLKDDLKLWVQNVIIYWACRNTQGQSTDNYLLSSKF